MSTLIGKINELLSHFKEGSNKKTLIKYENYDYKLCLWHCLAYHLTESDEERNIHEMMIYLCKIYYDNC